MLKPTGGSTKDLSKTRFKPDRTKHCYSGHHRRDPAPVLRGPTPSSDRHGIKLTKEKMEDIFGCGEYRLEILAHPIVAC